MKTLLAVTTANQLKYTKLFLESYNEARPSNVDLVIVDDASEDGTVEHCKKEGIEIVSKSKPRGLTHSWNLAYKKFKENSYEYLILSNNDILAPQNAIEKLIECTKDNLIVGPLCNSKGVPFNPIQEVKNYLSSDHDDNDPTNFRLFQTRLVDTQKDSLQVEKINGFIFCLNRNIINYEYSEFELFDPRNKNIANEDELCEKVPSGKVICLKSFFFHYKGVSFKPFALEDGNYHLERNLTWKEASRLQKNKSFFILYKIWRKVKEAIGIGRKS